MPQPHLVPSLIETTGHVEPGRAFEFWHDTALARLGDVERANRRGPFFAKRLSVAMPDWSLTHTVSSPVGVTIRDRHIDRNARDMVVIGLGLRGIGYQQQGERGAQLGPGRIGVLSRSRPLVTGTRSDYEEIRLAVTRETFEARIGPVDVLSGGCLDGPSASAEFGAFQRRLAATVAWMTPEEAQAAVEGALHLLSRMVRDAGGPGGADLPQAAVEQLARAHIIRRIHDPSLGPGEIQVAMGLSRAQLYRAFAEAGGVATVIRDLRLDLAYHRLTARRDDALSIATIAYGCGFTDVPTFNRAFRRRFDASPRDVRACSTA